MSSKERLDELQEKLNSEGLTDSENAELIVLQKHHGKGIEPKLTISIDTSKELEDLRKRLQDAETTRDDYKEKLALKAEKAFLSRVQRCHQKGYSGDILDPEELMRAEASLGLSEAGSKAGGMTPLSPQQTGQNDDKQYFSSKTEALTYLEKQAKSGNVEAQRQLKQAWRRTERKSGTFEFEGGLKDLKEGKGNWKKLGKRDKEDE